MQPQTCFNIKNFNMYLPQLENLTTFHSLSNEELFPDKSLVQALKENMSYDSDMIGQSLMTQRPTVDGLAMSRKLYSNCNLLNASNTQNLDLTVPKIMPQTNHMSNMTANRTDQDFVHKHPNYLNVACLPFAQQFYSLDSFNNLRYPQLLSPPTQSDSDEGPDKFSGYKSAFSAQEHRDQKLA